MSNSSNNNVYNFFSPPTEKELKRREKKEAKRLEKEEEKRKKRERIIREDQLRKEKEQRNRIMEQSIEDSKAAAAAKAASKSKGPHKQKSKRPGPPKPKSEGPSSLALVESASITRKRPSGTGPTAAAVPPSPLATDVVRTVKKNKNKIEEEVERRFQLIKHDVLKYSPAVIRRKKMFEGIFKQCEKDQKNLEKQLEDLVRTCDGHRNSWNIEVEKENDRLYRQARFELKRQVEKEEREKKLKRKTERPAALNTEQERRTKIVQNEVASDLWKKFIKNDNVRVKNKLSQPFREELKGYYELFKPKETRAPKDKKLYLYEDDEDFRAKLSDTGLYDSIYLKVRNNVNSDKPENYYWIQIDNSIQFVKSFHRFTESQDSEIIDSVINLYGKKKRKGTVSKKNIPKKKSRKKKK